MDQSTKEMRLTAWAGMVSACNSSGKTIKEWCRENGISEKTYHYRKRAVRECLYSEIRMPEDSEISSGCTTSFVPAAILRMGNISLELSNEVSPALLESISGMLHHAE